MSLKHYQNLQQQAAQDPQVLGCVLPTLINASLDCHSSIKSAQQVQTMMKEFNPQQGWLMTRDKVMINATTDTLFEAGLIEGEWCHGDDTIKVKLMGGDCYQVTQMGLLAVQNDDQVYSEQTQFLRKNLKCENTHNTVVYRLWWQLGQGDNERRWLPMAQQFIGFANHEEPQK